MRVVAAAVDVGVVPASTIISSPPKVAWSVSGVNVSAGGPKATTSAVDEAEEVASVRRALEIVRRVEDRRAVVAQLAHQCRDGLLGRAVDAGHRLVEEQDRRLLHQRAGEEHALLLSARERADLSIAEGVHADPLERLRHRLVGRRRRAPRSGRCAGIGPSARPARR